MNTPFIILSNILNPLAVDNAEWIPDGAIVVNENGCIEYVDRASCIPGKYASLQKIDLTDHILAPGFIDLHTHLPQLNCRGKFGESLLNWLTKFIYPEEAKFQHEDIARWITKDFFHALRRCGITTSVIYAPSYKHAVQIAFEEAEHSNIRTIMGMTLMDRNVPEVLLQNFNDALRETEELIEKWNRKNDKLFYAIIPRFAASCSMELMKSCASLTEKYDLYIQTHINESQYEIEWVRSLFPYHQHYMHVYEDAGMLTSKTILAHNIHAQEEEFLMCMKHNCAVAHCPDSNLFLGSGKFSIEKHEQYQIQFGLGSDVGAGTTLDMFSIMRSMSHVQQRSLHPFNLLYHAILGGARALSLDNTIGNFEIGKSFDAIAVDAKSILQLSNIQTISATDVASAFVYLADASMIEKVFVQGIELSTPTV